MFCGVGRLTAISFSRLVRARPQPGPVLSCGIPRIHRAYGPLRLLLAPAPEGTLLGPPRSPNRSPVLQVTASAYVLRPIPRRAGRPSHVGASGRPRRPSSSTRRLGARVTPFEACSGFTHVAARTLADPP